MQPQRAMAVSLCRAGPAAAPQDSQAKLLHRRHARLPSCPHPSCAHREEDVADDIIEIDRLVSLGVAAGEQCGKLTAQAPRLCSPPQNAAHAPSHAVDIKKCKDAGFHTVRGLLMQPRKARERCRVQRPHAACCSLLVHSPSSAPSPPSCASRRTWPTSREFQRPRSRSSLRLRERWTQAAAGALRWPTTSRGRRRSGTSLPVRGED